MHKNAVLLWVLAGMLFAYWLGAGFHSDWQVDNDPLVGSVGIVILLVGFHIGVAASRMNQNGGNA